MLVNEQIAIDHGLKKDEYKKICDLLKRSAYSYCETELRQIPIMNVSAPY